MKKCKGLTVRTRRLAVGYYCKVEGKHYLILEDASIFNWGSDLELIEDFVEIDPKTVKFIEDENG